VVGVSVELPVLNRNQGPIGEADARRSESAARFLQVQASVLAAFDRAVANRDQAVGAVAHAGELAIAAQNRLREATRALRAGATDRATLLDVELAAMQAQRTHLDARARLQQALGELEATVQPPLPVDVAAIEGEAP
jgi:outer membrane protein TolC